VSLESVKANAAFARSETDIAKKLDFLACAIEELANEIARAYIIPRSLPPEPQTPEEDGEQGIAS
jgi:hypothetical protein